MDLALVGSDCYIKAHFFGVRRAKEFKVLKLFVSIFVLFLIKKLRKLKYLRGSQFFPSY